MYLANFKSESDTIEVIQNTITEIQSNISSLKEEDTLVESKISDINNKIEEINQAIINIDVDRNIQNWIEGSLKGSNTISYEDNTL
jgi:chromosome segregation ATPase